MATEITLAWDDFVQQESDKVNFFWGEGFEASGDTLTGVRLDVLMRVAINDPKQKFHGKMEYLLEDSSSVDQGPQVSGNEESGQTPALDKINGNIGIQIGSSTRHTESTRIVLFADPTLETTIRNRRLFNNRVNLYSKNISPTNYSTFDLKPHMNGNYKSDNAIVEYIITLEDALGIPQRVATCRYVSNVGGESQVTVSGTVATI